MFMGSKDTVVWENDEKHVVSYRGEHYVLDGKRTTKKRILRRFSMSEDDLRAEGDFQIKREKPRPVRWVF